MLIHSYIVATETLPRSTLEKCPEKVPQLSPTYLRRLRAHVISESSANDACCRRCQMAEARRRCGRGAVQVTGRLALIGG